MGEETSDAMNLDLNLSPGPEPTLGSVSNVPMTLDERIDNPLHRFREAVRIGARQRSRWRRLQIPPEAHNLSMELNHLMVNSSNATTLQAGEGSVDAVERTNHMPKTCEINNLEEDASENKNDIEKGNASDGSFFDCNICLDLSRNPVVTCCGHLFCWSCLYRWLHLHSEAKECPVCKGEVTLKNVTPIYGRGNHKLEPEEDSSLKIPARPHARRVESLRQTIQRSALSFPVEEMIRRLGSRFDLTRDFSQPHEPESVRETAERASLLNRFLTTRGLRREQNPVEPTEEVVMDLNQSNMVGPEVVENRRLQSLFLRRTQSQRAAFSSLSLTRKHTIIHYHYSLSNFLLLLLLHPTPNAFPPSLLLLLPLITTKMPILFTSTPTHISFLSHLCKCNPTTTDATLSLSSSSFSSLLNPLRRKIRLPICFSSSSTSSSSEVFERRPDREAAAAAAAARALEETSAASSEALRQARRSADWKAAKSYNDDRRIYEGRIEGFNNGGLLIKFRSLVGFLPYPQLSPSHFFKEEPRRTPQDVARSLIGSLIAVKVIQADEENRKLIFSEKEAVWSKFSDQVDIGDIYEGKVGSVEDYGAFVHLRFPDGLYHLTGLVHVSEVSWDLVQDVRDILSEGDDVRVKVLSIDRQKPRMTLSIKQLEEDPLLETLDKVIPQDGADGSDSLNTSSISNIEPLQGLETIFEELLKEDGVYDVRITRQGFEKRVVSQDLQLWLSNAPATDEKSTLLARAGRQVQEIQLTTSLDQEGIKKALQRVLERIP